MKSIKSSSIFTSNNSIPLIIFVFIFIGVGMFFLIQKTTEKQQNKQAQQKSNSDDDSSSGVNLEQKIIKDSRNMPNQMNNNTSSNNQGNAQFRNQAPVQSAKTQRGPRDRYRQSGVTHRPWADGRTQPELAY